MREFKDVCDSISPKQFIFCSDNQMWNRVEHTINVKLTFTIMMIAFNPNSICFKNSTDFLCLDRVKSIKIDSDSSALGLVFTVVCGDNKSSTNDISYTIIAR